ncbi:hypothetical protein L915_00659 [Phytophthora nicotianae]|uniref:Uncharacterized protein n=1 Tax=Phytophthora nicotianae TaxID=4792 RepID=W2P8U3_PHYNI|nr:hypothetical protein L915_00659 [Phytophthora nicotianae]ETM56369.1 hypothetical protein L914_00650 [Phytophthora nicotianae]
MDLYGFVNETSHWYLLKPSRVNHAKIKTKQQGHLMPAPLFKRRYRHRQVQQALDKEEEGLTRDIYDVDQYLAKGG